jgi:hypothetical protein
VNDVGVSVSVFGTEIVPGLDVLEAIDETPGSYVHEITGVKGRLGSKDRWLMRD